MPRGRLGVCIGLHVVLRLGWFSLPQDEDADDGDAHAEEDKDAYRYAHPRPPRQVALAGIPREHVLRGTLCTGTHTHPANQWNTIHKRKDRKGRHEKARESKRRDCLCM